MAFSGMPIGSNHIGRFTRSIPWGDGIPNNYLDCYIYRLLSQGANRAVGRRYLANLTGLRERDLRRLIEKERRAGIPILSNDRDGYYLPADAEEVRKFLKSMYHRADAIRKTADAIRDAYKLEEWPRSREKSRLFPAPDPFDTLLTRFRRPFGTFSACFRSDKKTLKSVINAFFDWNQKLFECLILLLAHLAHLTRLCVFVSFNTVG